MVQHHVIGYSQDTVIVKACRCMSVGVVRPPSRFGIDNDLVEDPGKGGGLRNSRQVWNAVDEICESVWLGYIWQLFDVLVGDERTRDDICPLTIVLYAVSRNSDLRNLD
jgi:hypothetical protein